jgi:hypothetical protein
MRSFKDLVSEVKPIQATKLEKLTGVKPKNGRHSSEKIFTFKDGSSAVMRIDKPDDSRIEYYDSKMNFLTSYISAAALASYLRDSNLINEATY